jgi:hypothetical protein
VLLKLTPVDVAFAAENAGLAAAVAAFYQAKNYANSAAVGLWDATYADVLFSAGNGTLWWSPGRSTN